MMRAVPLTLVMLLLTTTVSAQDRSKESRCSEIAHRIACHAVSDCSKRESDVAFEKRTNLEGMIQRLCVQGPNTFDEYWWIDVTGAYRPYYADRKGGKHKFPPEQTK